MNKVTAVVVGVASVGLLGAGAADAVSLINATDLAAGVTDIKDTATTVSSAAWTIAFTVTGLSIAFGLFKKFMSKGAS